MLNKYSGFTNITDLVIWQILDQRTAGLMEVHIKTSFYC